MVAAAAAAIQPATAAAATEQLDRRFVTMLAGAYAMGAGHTAAAAASAIAGAQTPAALAASVAVAAQRLSAAHLSQLMRSISPQQLQQPAVLGNT